MMTTTKETASWLIRTASRLAGVLRVPGDKSIGHRALLFSALSRGTCRLSGLSGGADNSSTAGALSALGVPIEPQGAGCALVHGVGLRGLSVPSGPLDCGNSGTSMRLLAGLLSAQPFASVLCGDEYLTKRPMRRVAEPLARMGARITGRAGSKAGEIYPPLHIDGGSLRGMDYRMPIASAQVKSALILAALYASSPTSLHEPGRSRDHTERMLKSMGAPLSAHQGVIDISPDRWNGELVAQDVSVPGDPSSAAFMIAAALIAGARAGDVTVEQVCINPTRTGFLDVLGQMGARIECTNPRDMAGEPVADLVVFSTGGLKGVEVAGELALRSIDEIPILAAVASRARGTTIVRDAAELRVKESDRIVTTLKMLRALGVKADELADGLVIHGEPDALFRAASVDSAGDHRIAMSAAVLALAADGASIVHDVANVATSFPTFTKLLGELGAEIEEIY